MNKTTSEHLSRSAIVFARQSNPERVRNQVESQRWQHGLEKRARLLGLRVH